MKKYIWKITALVFCAAMLSVSLCGCGLLDQIGKFLPDLLGGKSEAPTEQVFTLTNATDFYAAPSWDAPVVATFYAGYEVTYDEVVPGTDGVEWAHCEEGWFCLNGSKPVPVVDYYGLGRDGILRYDAAVYAEPFLSSEQVDLVAAGTPVYVDQVAESSDGTWGQIEGGWVLMGNIYLTGDRGELQGFAVSRESTAVFYSRPGVQSHTTAATGTDTRFEVLDQIEIDGSWYGYTENGWVNMADVYVEGTAGLYPCRVMVIDSTPLNVRSGPGTDFSKLDKLYYGDYVDILERVERNGSDWGYTGTGWIFMDLTEIQ